jgi:hypothetical protein
VRRRDPAREDLALVALVDAVDEGAVALRIGVEVVAEAAVDERVDDVGEADEEIEAEALDAQREDVLRADPLEAGDRAVPVEEARLVALELGVEAVTLGQLGPELVDDRARLGPALVAVAADHVGDDEAAVRRQRRADAVEHALERDDVVQRLVREDRVVAPGERLAVDVDAAADDVALDALGARERVAAREHLGVDLEAVDREVVVARFAQRLREPHLHVAVAGAEARDPAAAAVGREARARVLREERVGMREAVRLEHRAQVAVRPVVEDRRQRVHVEASRRRTPARRLPASGSAAARRCGAMPREESASRPRRSLRRLGFAAQRVKQREALRRDPAVVGRRADRASGSRSWRQSRNRQWPISGRISTNASGNRSRSACPMPNTFMPGESTEPAAARPARA